MYRFSLKALLALLMIALPAQADDFDGHVIYSWDANDAPGGELKVVEDENGGQVRIWDREGTNKTMSGWRAYVSPNSEAEFGWSADGGRDGSGALYIRSDGPQTALWQIGLPVVGGATYQISVWAKVQDTKGNTFLTGRFKDEDGKWVASTAGKFDSMHDDVFLRDTTGWRQLTYQFKAPNDGDEVMIHLTNRFGDGDEVWFDDIEVKEAVAPQLRRDGPEIAAAISEATDQLRAMEREVDEDVVERVADFPRLVKQRLTLIERDPTNIAVRRAAWHVLREGVEIQRQLERAAQIATLAHQHPQQRVAGAWVSSMDRVFIDDLPMPANQATGEIALFRGEQEAAQLVLVPFSDLDEVSLRITQRSGPTGAQALSAQDIAWKVVGYVKIDRPSANHRRTDPFLYAGWWPDPLLERESVSLEAEHFQPLWLQVRSPRDATAGVYTFDVQVVDSAGAVLMTSPLQVEVWDGALPEKWYMKNTLGFSLKLASQAPWSGAQKTYASYDQERWLEVRDAYFKMLIDYRVGIGTQFYESITEWPVEWLKRAEAAGQELFVNSAGVGRVDEAGRPYLNAKDQRRIAHALGPAADMLESNGLLDKTYYYGFDEQWPLMFDLAAQTFQEAKDRGYRTMSTIFDFSYGTDTSLGSSLDVFVPKPARYNGEMAARARAEGRDVWVYTTSDFNIETDAMYQRLRPWDVMQMQAGGYWIWAMNRWVGNDGPISDEVRSEWNPFLDGATPHSSAMIIYPGKDGPISSIRLENYRDGIEDYDLLAHAAARMQGDHEDARDAHVRLLRQLGVSDEVFEMTPEQVLTVRSRLVEYLD